MNDSIAASLKDLSTRLRDIDSTLVKLVEGKDDILDSGSTVHSDPNNNKRQSVKSIEPWKTLGRLGYRIGQANNKAEELLHPMANPIHICLSNLGIAISKINIRWPTIINEQRVVIPDPDGIEVDLPKWNDTWTNIEEVVKEHSLILADLIKQIGGTVKETNQLSADSKNVHSDDFSSVLWYGETYTFNATQALCVEMLWNAWEQSPGLGLREANIGEKLKSDNLKFRLVHVFRQKGKLHLCWEKMIHGRGDGSFYLGSPQEN